MPHCLRYYHCVSIRPIIQEIIKYFHLFADSCIGANCQHKDFTGRVLPWENFNSPQNNKFHTHNFFFLARNSPASREMLDRRWANVVTYVGATSANGVGPTWICPSVQRWHNVATPPTMTLCQRFANVITYCIVIFDGWYYVCILFIPVNMP